MQGQTEQKNYPITKGKALFEREGARNSEATDRIGLLRRQD